MEVLICLLTLLLILLLYWVNQRKRHFETFKNLGIPGPKPNFWWGNLPDLNNGVGETFLKWQEEFGDVFGVFFGHRPFLCVSDPEELKRILIKDAFHFPKKDLYIDNLGLPDERGSQFVEVKTGQEWKTLRAILSTTFSTGKLKQMVPLINEEVEKFLGKIESQARQECVDLLQPLSHLLMDTSFSVFTGIKANIQDNPNQEIVQHLMSIDNFHFDAIVFKLSLCFPFFAPLLKTAFIFLSKFGLFKQGEGASYIFDRGEEVYRARLQYTDYPRKDVLQLMVDYNREVESKSKNKSNEEIGNEDEAKRPLTEAEIVSNCSMFVAGGFETTKEAIAFTCHVLMHRRDIQEEIRKEIKKVVGTKKTIDYDDLLNLKYLDQVILEVHRFYTLTTIGTTRAAEEDYIIMEKKIPHSIPIVVPTYTMHRSRRFWKDPEKFDPERFSSENKSEIISIAFQPFGAGPRTCVGMKFAQMNTKLILAHLLINYRLKPCSKSDMEDPEIGDLFFLRYLKRGLNVALEKVQD